MDASGHGDAFHLVLMFVVGVGDVRGKGCDETIEEVAGHNRLAVSGENFPVGQANRRYFKNIRVVPLFDGSSEQDIRPDVGSSGAEILSARHKRLQ